MSTPENVRRMLAQKIARTLFTDNHGKQCDRLEMKYKTDTGEISSGVGWGQRAVVEQIVFILTKAE